MFPIRGSALTEGNRQPSDIGMIHTMMEILVMVLLNLLAGLLLVRLGDVGT